MRESTIEDRARRHAALGEPLRLRIVDELCGSDRSPVELRHLLGVESNLLAHHLDVLEEVGLISRTRSIGDGRRRYVRLVRPTLDDVTIGRSVVPQPAVFVCTRNSARSQLAAAVWKQAVHAEAMSAGTHPADAVHPGAVAAARRAGLDLSDSIPRSVNDVELGSALVVTVCDQAHEELGDHDGWLHWSVPDPVATGTRAAFDATLAELRERIRTVVAADAAA